VDAHVQFNENLERLLAGLETKFQGLVECRIAPGWRVSLPPIDMCGICYTSGSPGTMTAGRLAPMPLCPNSVAVVPSGKPLWLQGPAGRGLRTVSLSQLTATSSQAVTPKDPIFAGVSEHTTDVVYIPFRANWGTVRDLFGNIQAPILNEFGEDERIGETFSSVVAEFRTSQFGSGAMLNSLLKQIIIVLVRRSLDPSGRWPQRLAILQDPPINRVFSGMVAFPGAQYSVTALSQTAGLSRSAFMARFVAALGSPPFVILRELRMRQAAELLGSKSMTIDQVARAVGYGSRSSFARAFRLVYGIDPSGRGESAEKRPREEGQARPG
jgi:AraC family transcriptional activator of mtrCDE